MAKLTKAQLELIQSMSDDQRAEAFKALAPKQTGALYLVVEFQGEKFLGITHYMMSSNTMKASHSADTMVALSDKVRAGEVKLDEANEGLKAYFQHGRDADGTVRVGGVELDTAAAREKREEQQEEWEARRRRRNGTAGGQPTVNLGG